MVSYLEGSAYTNAKRHLADIRNTLLLNLHMKRSRQGIDERIVLGIIAEYAFDMKFVTGAGLASTSPMAVLKPAKFLKRNL